MLCLECEVEMASGTLAGVQVDRCPKCEGVWFDAGELEAVRANTSDREHEAPVLFEEQRRLDTPCPSCGAQELVHGYAKGQDVERCNACRGLFLDGFEIERFLKEWRTRWDGDAAITRGSALTGLVDFLGTLLRG